MTHPSDSQEAPKSVSPAPRTVPLKTVLFVGVFLLFAAFILGSRSQTLLAQLTTPKQNKDLPAQLDFSSVNELYAQLKGKFDGMLDSAKLIDGAKKGLVDAAGDPYTTYFTADEAKEFESSLNGSFSGIGAELSKEDDKAKVVSTIDNSPAKNAGLLSGDIILKVNDQDVSGLALEKIVSSIRGEKGTSVKINILRGSEAKEFSIVRADIVDPSVKSEITADNVAVMRISRFASDTGELSRKFAEEYKQKNVKGVVLDLRGNGGGYVDAARDVAGLWLNNKVVVEERQGDKVLSTIRTGSNAVLNDIKTVVLVDGGSASASEIVAGALHDHKAATLLGEKTFGKGSVQETLPSIDGMLKVTIAKWFTPNGKNINKEGIEPDEKVTIGEADIAAKNDAQRNAALNQLKN